MTAKLTRCIARLVWVPNPLRWRAGWVDVRDSVDRLVVQAFCVGPLELQWWPETRVES